MATAVEPTPPVAPLTITGPLSGVIPAASIASSEIAAVSPAVPSTIASSALMPSGAGTSQSAGTRTRSA